MPVCEQCNSTDTKRPCKIACFTEAAFAEGDGIRIDGEVVFPVFRQGLVMATSYQVLPFGTQYSGYKVYRLDPENNSWPDYALLVAMAADSHIANRGVGHGDGQQHGQRYWV